MGSIVRLCFVCERICGFCVRTCLLLDNFVSAWSVLHEYVLVDVQAFVILFQSGGLEYKLLYSDWGGAVVNICKTVFVYAGKSALGG